MRPEESIQYQCPPVDSQPVSMAPLSRSQYQPVPSLTQPPDIMRPEESIRYHALPSETQPVRINASSPT